MKQIVNYFTYAYREWQDETYTESEPFMTYYKLRQYLKEALPCFFLCINSLYINGQHIPFYDFDCDHDVNEAELALEKRKIFEHIIEQIHKYQLDGYLFETAHGYHLILNTLWSPTTYMSSFKRLGCCNGFASFTRKRGYACLRIGNKPGREPDMRYLGYISYGVFEKQMHPAVEEYFIMREHLNNLLRK